MKTTAVATLLFALTTIGSTAAPAHAQTTAPHEEACVTWGFMRSANYAFGAPNMCPYAVETWFLTGDGRAAQGRTEPREIFTTGLVREVFNPPVIGWFAATCRAGYAPSVSVSRENWDAIREGRYECVSR
jgi:hypothetical protein